MATIGPDGNKKSRPFRAGFSYVNVATLGLVGTLTITANVVALKSLQRSSLSDALVDVGRRGVLHALTGHLAGEDERERVTTLRSLLLTLGSNGSSTLSLSLGGLGILDIGIHGIDLLRYNYGWIVR